MIKKILETIVKPILIPLESSSNPLETLWNTLNPPETFWSNPKTY